MPVTLLRLDRRYTMLPQLAGIDEQWWCPRCSLVVPETHAHEDELDKAPDQTPTPRRQEPDVTQVEMEFDA